MKHFLKICLSFPVKLIVLITKTVFYAFFILFYTHVSNSHKVWFFIYLILNKNFLVWIITKLSSIWLTIDPAIIYHRIDVPSVLVAFFHCTDIFFYPSLYYILLDFQNINPNKNVNNVMSRKSNTRHLSYHKMSS